MISFISASAVMFIMAVAGTSELHNILFWIMGSLEDASMGDVYLPIIVIFLGFVISVSFSHSLNAINLGDEGALHLGVNVVKTKKALFFIASLLTGISVSISGIIGFVGLVVPHFVRMFTGNDYRILIIASFFAGGIFLLACDTAARTIISPMELPVGVITGIAGGIAFIFFLVRRKNNVKYL
jgi:iron complex transport system permease protein